MADPAPAAAHAPFYLLTHPDVVISRDVPVPRWPLSARGLARMRAGLRQPWVAGAGAIYCSTEQKAIDGARVLAEHLALPFTELADLGENDRSATGFLPPAEFEAVADAFFAQPGHSVRGWERALAAQARMVRAVERISAAERDTARVLIVAHGAVGTLLYCHLAGLPIDRRWDQPPNRGGNYFGFSMQPRQVFSWWQALDAPAPALSPGAAPGRHAPPAG
jgi:broad specificity phosphatase PhoE